MVASTIFSFDGGERMPSGAETPDKFARLRIVGSSNFAISLREGVLFRSQSTESFRALQEATDGTSGSIGTGVPVKFANARIAGSSNSSLPDIFDRIQLTESSIIALFLLGTMEPDGNAIPARFASA